MTDADSNIDHHPEDIRNIIQCYRVILGRDPENAAVVEQFRTRPIGNLIKGALASNEFFEGVIREIMRGGQPRHALRTAKPSRAQIDWMFEHLTAPQAVQSRVRSANNWAEFFVQLLKAEDIARLVPGLHGVPLFYSPLPRTPAAADAGVDLSERQIVGSIDQCVGTDVRGWAANRANPNEIVTLEIRANGHPIGTVRCDEFRRDVQESIGGSNGLFGFQFTIPAMLKQVYPGSFAVTALDLLSGQPIAGSVRADLSHENNLNVLQQLHQKLAEIEAALTALKQQLPATSVLTSYSLDGYDEYFRHTRAINLHARLRQAETAAGFAYRPRFSIVVPTFNSDLLLLETALRSVAAQTWPEWELLVCDDRSDNRIEIQQVLDRVFPHDARVAWLPSDERGGVSENTNKGIGRAAGDYVCFLDHDDALTDDALFRVAQTLQARRFKLLYSDEDRSSFDENGRLVYHTPFFKPDFDWDLLLGQNYLCHLVVVEAETARATGGLDSQFNGAQDHDFVLRVLERITPDEVGHIADVLYHWHVNAESISQASGSAEKIEERIIQLVDAHLTRRGLPAQADRLVDTFGGSRSFTARVQWQLPDPAPKTSIIIPTRDRPDLLGPCLTSLLATRRDYPGQLEIVVVDNNSEETQTQAFLRSLRSMDVQVRHYDGRFNWSAINNFVAKESDSDVFVFLNNDTIIKEPRSIGNLVAHAIRPEVGAVGARLLYEDGTVQHSGVLIGLGGSAGHDGIGMHAAEPGYFGRQFLTHQVSAVTGACLATRREVFEAVGGFDEIHFKVSFNDVDYCLRVREKNLAVIYEPSVVLYHFESKSRGFDTTLEKRRLLQFEAKQFNQRWHEVIEHDPFYNPRFERNFKPFSRLRLRSTAEAMV